jgi:hypothetical protein
MFNQAVRAAEAGCASKDPDIRADLHRAFASAAHLHGEHAAKSDHLTGRNLMTRMAGQTRVVDRLYCLVRVQECSNPAGALCLCSHTTR